MRTGTKTKKIGTLNEQPLHAGLKDYYTGASGLKEVRVDGFIVDVIINGELIEIQTGNFSGIKSKLNQLVPHHQIRLVFPIIVEKWLLKRGKEAHEGSKRRKSPKRETLYQLFNELVAFPELISHHNFSLECVEVVIEEVRAYTGEKTWRNHGWVPVERRLIEVIQSYQFPDTETLETLLPDVLLDQFTTSDLASSVGIPIWLSQKMCYCYRKMGSIRVAGKQGRFKLYERCSSSHQKPSP